MEEKVKASVIIPCYNHGKFIDKAVNSVLNQTFQNFEIIIVNDGSTDEETNKILENYNRPKTKVIKIENQGPSVARNTGIQEAKGEYILPLDADDTIEPTYMEKAVKILDNDDNVGIVYCDIKLIVKNKFFKKVKTSCLHYKFPECLLFRTSNIFTVSSFFRKKDWTTVGGFNQNMVAGLEDYNFWLSLIELGIKVSHINEPLLNYYRTCKSRDSSMTLEEQKNCYIQIYKNHKTMYLENIEIILKHSVELSLNNMRIKSLNKRLIFSLILACGGLLGLLALLIFRSLLWNG